MELHSFNAELREVTFLGTTIRTLIVRQSAQMTLTGSGKPKMNVRAFELPGFAPASADELRAAGIVRHLRDIIKHAEVKVRQPKHQAGASFTVEEQRDWTGVTLAASFERVENWFLAQQKDAEDKARDNRPVPIPDKKAPKERTARQRKRGASAIAEPAASADTVTSNGAPAPSVA